MWVDAWTNRTQAPGGPGMEPGPSRLAGLGTKPGNLPPAIALACALQALGVPTTRALSLVATGEEVMRDM